MKKRNVKYIGSAVAVALLAAGSPVIINNFIPTTVVHADDTATTETDPAKMNAEEAAEYFKNEIAGSDGTPQTFYAQQISSLSDFLGQQDQYNFFSPRELNEDISLKGAQQNQYIHGLMKSGANSESTRGIFVNNNEAKQTRVRMTITSRGKDITYGSTDWNNFVNTLKNGQKSEGQAAAIATMPVVLTYHIENSSFPNGSINFSVYYDLTNDHRYATNISDHTVSNGSNIADINTGITLEPKEGDSAFGDPVYGEKYYATSEDAINAAKGQSISDVTDTYVSDNKFIKTTDSTPIYQLVTYTDSDNNRPVSSLTYSDLNWVGKTPDIDYAVNINAKTVSFVRAIKITLDSDAAKEEASEFKNEFGNVTNTDTVINLLNDVNTAYFDASKPVSLSNAQGDTTLQKLMKEYNTSLNLPNLIADNAKIYFTAANKNDSTKMYSTPQEISSAISNSNEPIIITGHLSSDTVLTDPSTDTFTFEIDPVNYKPTITNVTSSVNSNMDTSSQTLTADPSNDEASSFTSEWGNYYSSSSDALKEINSEANVVTTDGTNTTYAKAGTFYQAIKFKLPDDDVAKANAFVYEKSGTDATGNHNISSEGYVIYVRTVTIGADAVKAKSEASDFGKQFTSNVNTDDVISKFSTIGQSNSDSKYFGQSNAVDISTIQSDSNIINLLGDNFNSKLDINDLKDDKAKVYFTATDGINNYNSFSEIAQAMQSNKNLPITITGNIFGDTALANSNSNFQFTVSSINYTAEVNDKSVTANSSVADSEKGYALSSKTPAAPVFGKASFSGFYDISEGADKVLDGTATEDTNATKGDNFFTPNKYYQRVSFTIDGKYPVTAYEYTKSNKTQLADTYGDYLISEEGKTISFVREVDVTVDLSAVNKEALAFENEFGDKDNSDDVIDAFSNINNSSNDYFDSTKSTSISSLQNDTNISALMKNKTTIADMTDLDNAGVKVSFSAIDKSTGKTYASASEITAALKDNSNLPLTITGTLTADDGVTLDKDSFTFDINALSYNATVGDQGGTVGNKEITDSGDKILTGTKEASSSFGMATPVVGKYYIFATDALVGGTDGLVSDAVNKDGNYATADNYYQAETFTLPEGSTPATAYTYTKNGEPAVLDTDYAISADGMTITFVRKVNVILNNKSINENATAFESQFKAATNNDDVIKAFENIAGSTDDYFATGKETATSVLQNDANIKTLLGSSIADIDTAELDSADVTVTFTATDNNNKTYSSASEIAAALKANPNLPLTIKGKLSSSKVTLTNTDLTLVVKALIYNAVVNNDTKFFLGDAAPKDSNDTLKNSATNAATFGTPTLLTRAYYTSSVDALNGKNSVSAVDAEGNLIKSGDLYQTETFTISDSNDITANAYGYQLNGANATAFDGTTGDYLISQNGKTITFARKITVSVNDSAVQSEAQTFAEQFGNLNNTDSVISAVKNLDTKYLDATNPVAIADVKDDSNLQALMKKVSGLSLADLNYANGKVSFKFTSNDKELTTTDQIVAALEDSSAMPVTVTGQITTDDANVTLDKNGVFSFKITPLTYTVAIPDVSGKTNNPINTETTEYKITAKDSSESIDNPTFGKYYDMNTDGTKGTEDADVVSGTNYAKAGDFYQEVMFHVNSNAPASAYEFSKNGKILTLDADYTVSGDVVTFLRKVHVDPSAAATASLTKEVGVNAGMTVLDEQKGEKNDIRNDNNTIVDHVDFEKVYYAEDGKTDVTSDAIDGDKYKTPGTYYRQVTLTLKDGALDTNTITDLDGATQKGNTVTFMQTVIVSANGATVNTDAVTSTVGSSVSSLPAANNKYTLNLADDAKTPITATPSAEETVYKTYDPEKKQLSDAVTSFDSVGTYYRVITFSTTNADQYSFVDPNVISNKDGVITYVQSITVKPSSGGGSNTGNNTGTDNNGNGTGDEDDWTYYQNPGIVTTKTDHSIYTLNNHANQTISNRGLSADTAWKTDQYRTNRAGVKQYRVATGEWVDSHDVIFTDLNDNTNTNDDWTYYKDPGVVLTKVDQTYYTLNNWSNDKVLNRALDEQTYWLTDQYRTNRSGVKQYRVATNEWIDSHDVIYIKDIKDIVNVDETQTFYTLYTDELAPVQNRALEAKSSWRTDKEAIDSDGTVYYRVATNEWVKQVNGVHLDTSVWYKG